MGPGRARKRHHARRPQEQEVCLFKRMCCILAPVLHTGASIGTALQEVCLCKRMCCILVLQ
jgi:hypothetical protein